MSAVHDHPQRCKHPLRDARWTGTDAGPGTFAHAGRKVATEALRRHDAIEAG